MPIFEFCNLLTYNELLCPSSTGYATEHKIYEHHFTQFCLIMIKGRRIRTYNVKGVQNLNIEG